MNYPRGADGGFHSLPVALSPLLALPFLPGEFPLPSPVALLLWVHMVTAPADQLMSQHSIWSSTGDRTWGEQAQWVAGLFLEVSLLQDGQHNGTLSGSDFIRS